MNSSANQNAARLFEQRAQATGTGGPAPSFVSRMSKDDSFVPLRSTGSGGLGHTAGTGGASTNKVSGVGGTTAPKPGIKQPAISETNKGLVDNQSATTRETYKTTDANAHPFLPLGSKNIRPTSTFQTSNTSTNIHGRQFSGHALDEMRAQGIMPSVIEETIKSGKSFAGRNLDRTVFYDSKNNVSVVLEANGTVVTSSLGRLYGVK
jgi:filamentous hemagglutinin